MRAPAVAQLLAAATIALSTLAQAQPSQRSAEDPPPVYEDRLIDDGGLTPDIWDAYAPLSNTEGLPRGIRLDGLWSQMRRNGVSTTQAGAGLGAFLATPEYGSFSFDGLFTNGEDMSIATFWQRDMPFDGGWRASNGLGMLNTPAIDLVRFQPRLFLSTTPMVGAVTEWRTAQGAQAIGGYGQPGVYYGAYIPEFRRLKGQLTNLGAQWMADRHWSAGFQYAGANNVTNAFQLQSDPVPFSSRAVLLATARQDSNSRFQFNVLESQNSVTDSNQGAWLDGFLQTGRLAQSFGLFYLGSALLWGNQPVANDSRGGYYRMLYSGPRLLWDGGVDYVARMQSEETATTFLNGSVRYQFQRDLSAGTGGSVRLADSTAWQGFAYVEHVESFMTGRAQLNRAEDGDRQDTNLTFNQFWNTRAGTRLSTTVIVGRHRSDRVTASNHVALAAYGGGDIVRDLSLDLNLQWSRGYGDAEPTSTTGSLVLTWSILPELRLIATGYRSQVNARTPLAVSSPLDALRPVSSRVDDSGAFVILRYEARAGSMGTPLGGPPGAGAGRIAGTVFLDANESGRLDAGELGAANVTVVLDGRYSTRTDAQGRFEFPAVASGPHVLSVIPDNLPLPWALANEGRAEFDVPVRGAVDLEIAAQRLR